jgi:hypothetical protein
MSWDPRADIENALDEMDEPPVVEPVKRTVSFAPPPPPPGPPPTPAETSPVTEPPAIAPSPVEAPVKLAPATAPSRSVTSAQGRTATPKLPTRSGGAEASRTFGVDVALTIAQRLERARVEGEFHGRRFNLTKILTEGLSELPPDTAALLVTHDSVLNLAARLGDEDYVAMKRISLRLTETADNILRTRIKSHFDLSNEKIGRNDLIGIVLDRVLPTR